VLDIHTNTTHCYFDNTTVMTRLKISHTVDNKIMLTVVTTRIQCKLQTSGFFPNYYINLHTYSQIIYVKNIYVIVFYLLLLHVSVQ